MTLTAINFLLAAPAYHADAPRLLAIHAQLLALHRKAPQAMSSTDTAAYMHRRLHAGDARLRTLPETMCDESASLHGVKQRPCAACTRHADTHPSAHYTATQLGRLIHADIAGPFVSSLSSSHRYVLILSTITPALN
eukprot:6208280-Pleurochrysis_carterae.AAC.2